MSYYDDEDLEDSIEVDIFADDDDEYKAGCYEVWITGYDYNGRETDFNFRLSAHATEAEANDAIDEFCKSDPYDLQDTYEIPENIVELEIQGIKSTEDLFEEPELFRTMPVSL